MRALKVGVSQGDIFQTLEAQPDLAMREFLVLRAVDELMLSHRISEPTRAKLERDFSTEQLMDLVAIRGMYVTLGAFIHTWGLDLDSVVAGEIDTIANAADFDVAASAFARAIRLDGALSHPVT